MPARITWVAIQLSLIAACDSATPRRAASIDPSPSTTAEAPVRPVLTPPATVHRLARGKGPERLSDLGLPVAIRVPASARLDWLDGSPDAMDDVTATVRVTHDLDPDDGLLREHGLRLYLRATVGGEATELPAFEAHLRAEPARIAAEIATGHRELGEIEREMRAAGIAPSPPDELEEELAADTPLGLDIIHRRETPTGWELVWTLEEDGAATVKVWRADLGVFCIDVLASREAALRTLALCRTLARG